MLREHCSFEDRKQSEHTRALIRDWADFTLELYDSGRKRRAKRVIDLLHEGNFALNEI